MKNIYAVTLIDSAGRTLCVNVFASKMAAAIEAAQLYAGVSLDTDPVKFEKIHASITVTAAQKQCIRINAQGA